MARESLSGDQPAQADGLETARAAILAGALRLAPFEGWTVLTMRRAAAAEGVSRAALAAAFPAGVGDLLTYWSIRADAAMVAAIAAEDGFPALRIRDKVAFAVLGRLGALRADKEAARRAAATLALPMHAPRAARLAWRTADAIWRALGDASSDFNYYSKRAILTGVWTSTFARWLGDASEGERDTRAFLAARIENVMQFEKAKAQWRKAGFDPAEPARFLAKLRYRA